MRIFVPTLGDPGRLEKGLDFLRGMAHCGHDVFLVSERPIKDTEFEVLHCSIPAAYRGPGNGALTWKRQWIESRLDKKEWAASIDDGVSGLCGLDPKKYWNKDRLDWHGDKPVNGSWASKFGAVLSDKDASSYITSLVGRCLEVGTSYGGFTSANAALHRLTRWRYRAVVSSRLCVFRRDDKCRWMHAKTNAPVTHDWLKTIRAVAVYGSVVVDQWAKPAKKSYQAGGLGDFEDRREQMEKDVAIYCNEYGHLVEPHPTQPWIPRFKRKVS